MIPDPAPAVLSSLLGGHSVERFLAEVWERRHLHVRADEHPAFASTAKGLFDLDHADRMLTTPGPRFRDYVRLSQGGDPLEREVYSSPRADGLVDYDFDGVLDLYERGATITLNRAQQGSDTLAALCTDLSRELRAHVNANVYITPPRAQGFSAHPDTHDVFLIQVEGSKRWRVQVGLDYLATSRDRNRVSDPDRVERWDEFELHPGDVLYLPRGLLHAGMTDLSHSLHITLGIHPYVWSDVIRDALAELEHDDVALRRSATVGEALFDDALETVTSSLMALISDRARMRDLIERRTADQATGSRRGGFLALTDGDRIGLDTPLRRRPDVAVEVHATDDEVIVTTGTKSIAFPGYVAEHVEALLSDRPSTPRQLPASLDESGRLVLCRTLVAEGVLQVH